MKGLFKKKKSRPSSNEAEHDVPPAPPQVHGGFVSDYEQVASANDKVLAMLGVHDGPPAGTGAPARRYSASASSMLDGSQGSNPDRRETLRKETSRQSLTKTVARGLGLGGRKASNERSNSASTNRTSIKTSDHLVSSDHNSENARKRGSRGNSHRDIEHESSLGLQVESSDDQPISMMRRAQIDHTQLLFETNFEEFAMKERVKDWASSFRRTDPRYQILKYFNDVATSGVDNIEEDGNVTRAELLSPILAMWRRAAVFTVWRPTSTEAIQKMMLGRGTGKGLNIKGKSAKGGELSGYVPFVQINEDTHKAMIKTLPRDARIRIFYRKREIRDEAAERLREISKNMTDAVEEAKKVLESATPTPGCSKEEAERRMTWWDASNLDVTIVDDYAGNKGWGPFAKGFGVEISEKLMWEAFVCRQDITREAGSIYDTGRRSEPAFQDMNFGSTRVWKKGDPRTVLWQHSDPKKGQGPLEPRTLLVAYEENRLVLPVVSDFDCFLVGTRAVQFEKPIPKEQVDMLNWCIDHIEGVLDTPGSDLWSKRWLDVLKTNKPTGKGAHIPRFGYGDPKTYSIMECAVGRLGQSGAVRHGAECFNYYFPQDLDDEYLVILGDADAGKVPWIYVNEEQLRDLLCEKIDQGFTFPLNPKWVLCDPGWKKVYDKLLLSQKSNVQASLDCWYPPESGIRERIESIYSKHQFGFGILDEDGMSSPAPRRPCFESNHRLGIRHLELEVEDLQILNALEEEEEEEEEDE